MVVNLKAREAPQGDQCGECRVNSPSPKKTIYSGRERVEEDPPRGAGILPASGVASDTTQNPHVMVGRNQVVRQEPPKPQS
jgi:hypothetical protein